MNETSDLTWQELNRQVIACRRCPRLIQHCRDIAEKKRRAFADQSYWGRPVPAFGDPRARLVIVGLAPAAHGANRTGRMFTGDRSGDWLYRALHQTGFANQPTSVAADDGLQLQDCAVIATCHCAPPDNKPLRDELANCQSWLDAWLELLPARVYVALGGIAWKALFERLRAQGHHQGAIPKFSHAAERTLSLNVQPANQQASQQTTCNQQITVLGSYHPSQQNTFTGRLTEPMLRGVFARARELLQTAD